MFSLTPGRPTGTNMIMNLMCQSVSENISLERSYFFLCWLQRWTNWVYNFEYVFSTSYRSRNDELFFWFIILVIASIGEKRPIVDLFITIVFVLCIFCISYFRLQIWCQALQSLTTYLMLTTYSWMLCEGAYLRFILVFADYINTFRLFKIWLYIMD